MPFLYGFINITWASPTRALTLLQQFIPSYPPNAAPLFSFPYWDVTLWQLEHSVNRMRASIPTTSAFTTLIVTPQTVMSSLEHNLSATLSSCSFPELSEGRSHQPPLGPGLLAACRQESQIKHLRESAPSFEALFCQGAILEQNPSSLQHLTWQISAAHVSADTATLAVW